MKKKVIFIIGPTAIGKTEIAVKLARKISAEIISCDSMQVYKDMDIISAKPSKAIRRNIPHYVIDVASPKREYDCIQYQKDVLKAIGSINNKGKLPLIVGGTGFYMGALLDGVFKGAGANKKIRNKLYKEAEEKGMDSLYARLKKLDKLAASKIHPNDLRRIVRALEVVITTGKPISQLQKKRKGVLDDFDVRIFGLRRKRADLYKEINKRVDSMFRKGLVAEVKKLLKKKVNKTATQAIGIKELKGYLEGNCSLAEAKELMKRNTRRYAKRQFTWFNRDKRIEWVDVDGKNVDGIIRETVIKLDHRP